MVDEVEAVPRVPGVPVQVTEQRADDLQHGLVRDAGMPLDELPARHRMFVMPLRDLRQSSAVCGAFLWFLKIPI